MAIANSDKTTIQALVDSMDNQVNPVSMDKDNPVSTDKDNPVSMDKDNLVSTDKDNLVTETTNSDMANLVNTDRQYNLVTVITNTDKVNLVSTDKDNQVSTDKDNQVSTETSKDNQVSTETSKDKIPDLVEARIMAAASMDKVNQVSKDKVSMDKVSMVWETNTAVSKAAHKAIATSSVDRKKVVADPRDRITVADLMARDNLMVADKKSQGKMITAVTIVADNLTDRKGATTSSSNLGDAAETKRKTVSATREMRITEAAMVSRIHSISSAAAEATAVIIPAHKTAAHILDQEIPDTREGVVMAHKVVTRMMIHPMEAEVATATTVMVWNHQKVVAEVKNAVMAILLMVAVVTT